MSESTAVSDRRSLLQNALRSIDELQARLDAVERRQSEPIAIVGLGCRFPGGASDPDRYWQLLREGRDAIREMPAERRHFFAAQPDVAAAFNDMTWYGGFLDDLDQFDPAFFGISPREALTMDPQQRLVLEVAWEALERAGQAPDGLNGSATGVFIGVTTSDYSHLSRQGGVDQLDVYTATGGTLNAVAGRLAYTLGLQGPCVAIDTACSSSLVAIHLACQSLRSGESNLALAGGVNVVLLPESYLCCLRWGMLASDGRCKTFDARADGFVRSEGCGMVVLKRLADAQADGDPVLAVIRGSAVNQDGRSSGLTVPNGLAQQRVIRQALASARLQPAAVSYVETHGAGTTLGDPIEVEALAAVLGEGRSADQPLTIGAVKTNLGHCEAASGVAGLIKVVLSLQHQQVPPHLHLTERSPQIPWPAFPIAIPDQLQPWTVATGRRIAGVSSFGLSGTNAHIILEEAPAAPSSPPAQPRSRQLLPLSAKSAASLRQLAADYAAWLAASPPAAELADLCATAATGRAHFNHRLAVVADSADQLRASLAELAVGQTPVGAVQGVLRPGPRPRLAFLFTGHGAQYDDMARRLFDQEPVFRQALTQCDELLHPLLGRSLLSVLYPVPATARGDEAALRASMTYGLPALFAIQYGLVQLWRAWGITPSVVLGHSAGEYAAAHLAGVVSLADALTLVAARGRLLHSLAVDGAMVVVLASAERVADLIRPYHQTVAVAAINGPESVVISGREADVQAILAALTALGIEWRRLPIAQASHSPLVEPILADFERVAATVTYSEPRLTLISSRFGGVVQPGTITNAAYWRDHLRSPVAFLAAMTAAHAAGVSHYLEIGPHPTLLGMGRSCVPDGVGSWLPSLRQGRDEWAQLLESLGSLYVDGLLPNWQALEPAGRRPPVALPTYPFAREHYWLAPPPSAPLARPTATSTAGDHPLLGQRLRSPLLKEVVHQAALGATWPAYLGDHRVHGLVILPGVAYLELALAAGAAQTRGAVQVEQLRIHEPIVLPETGTGHVQTALSPGDDGLTELQIFWQAPTTDGSVGDDNAWQLKASGQLRLGLSAAPPPPVADVAALAGSARPVIAVDDYYKRLAAVGLDYGPCFRGIHQLWGGPGEAWAWLGLPAAEGLTAEQYHLHPALLDACFQVLGAALPASDDSGHFYMPVGIAGVRLWQPAAMAVWCHVQVAITDEEQPAQTMARLELYGQDGQPVATIEQVRIQRTSQQQLAQRLRRPINDLLYDLVWRPGPPLAPPAEPPAGWWLILADRQGLGAKLAERLAAGGARPLVVTAGEQLAASGDGRWQVDPLAPADLRQVIAAARADGLTSLAGVVYLWALDEAAPELERSAAEHQAATLRLTSGVLHLVQALEELAIGRWPALWLVTRGSQTVTETDEPPAVDGAALWGIAPSLSQELPGLRCRLIDLDPLADAGAAGLVADELGMTDEEARVAWRGRQRFVQRLVRHQAPAEVAPGPVALTITARGRLEHLVLQPQEFPPPGPGEVTIAVRATGLNFRDVMNALGILPGNVDAFGLECAGEVVAIGAGVTEVAVGQAVIAVTGQGYRSYVVTPARLVVAKPPSLSAAAAATLPIAFLTAAYGLFDLAQLKAGERVLVHAAAGGVGLATIQLAQRAGAEVLATAGSERKRQYLRALGVRHVFNSRQTDFAEQIMAVTEQQGVDLVINSLTDEFIPASLAVLRPRGHFLELGRRGVWGAAQVAAVRPDVTYTPYELGTLLSENPARFRALFTELMAAVERGELQPLPRRCFPFHQVVSAFHYMAQARHIGKVVVVHPDPATATPDQPPLIRPAAGYLITGGLGGLGLLLAQWLIDQGARHLALVGRRPPTDAAAARLADWRAAGVQVETYAADLADDQHVTSLATRLRQQLPPLGGLFHAAAVLDDGLALQQTTERGAPVLAPKVAGAWNLVRLLEGQCLDMVVLFSSASAVLGSAGQTVYAAGNAGLDALAHWLVSHGQPALSINWGAWGEVGQAAALGERERRRWQEAGIGFFAPATGLQVLETALQQRLTRLMVVQVDWSRLGQRAAPNAVPGLLTELIGAAPPRPNAVAAAPVAEAVLERLRAVAGDERLDLITGYVQEQVARVLRVAHAQSIQPQQPLQEYGLDSLMAVELRNRLQADLQVSMPLRSLLGGNSIASLAVQLIAMVPAEPDPAPLTSDADRALSPGEAEQLLADLDRLSDDEVATLLATLTATDKE